MNHAIKRLQSFSDAVLAIAATILAVPLAKIDEKVRLDMYLRGKTLKDVITSDYQLESFAMFIGSFSLIFIVWVRHGRQFTRLSREEVAGETPALLVTNMLELFLATLLPYTTASASRARSKTDDVEERRKLALPFCANVFALATTRVVFESLALRARPSVGFGFYNLCEAVSEMACAMLVLALASSVLNDEEIFLPFLAIPLISVLVRLVLTRMYGGSPDSQRMDWHRLEGFVDGCIAVVSTLMILEIKPPANCYDLKPETCVLHFNEGCRLQIDLEHVLKPLTCHLELEKDQKQDLSLFGTYFACFSLMVYLWYSHHEVIWFGYAFDKKQRNKELSEGSFRALFGSGWFCASIGLFPFSFTLFSEFAVFPYDERHDPRIFPEFEEPLDINASYTACVFTLWVLFMTGLPLLFLLFTAPKRNKIPYGVRFRVFLLPVLSLFNLLLIYLREETKLFPFIALLPLIAFSNLITRCFENNNDENNGATTDLLNAIDEISVARQPSERLMMYDEPESAPSTGGRSSTGRRSASADAEYRAFG